jgi:Protein of unknown function (DUF1488)
MALNFPNQSRSFDARGNVVRFWGYDSALEIPFFVEVGALCKLDPQWPNVEAAYLAKFDAALDRIREAARKVYKRGRKASYVLAATDLAT